MFRRPVPIALFAALVLPLSGAKKADEEAVEVTWQHPYLKDYRFDYDHNRKEPLDPKKFTVHYESLDTSFEFLESRETISTQEYVLRYKDVDVVPQMLYLDTLDSARGAEVIEFEASFTSAGLTEKLDRSQVLEVSADDGGRYVDGDTALALVVPRHRLGTLTVKLRVRQDPFEGGQGYFAGFIPVPAGRTCATRSISITVPEGETLRFDQRTSTRSLATGALP